MRVRRLGDWLGARSVLLLAREYPRVGSPNCGRRGVCHEVPATAMAAHRQLSLVADAFDPRFSTHPGPSLAAAAQTGVFSLERLPTRSRTILTTGVLRHLRISST